MNLINVSEIDLAKAAAFIDGEGYVGIVKNRRPGRPTQPPAYPLVIQVAQTDRRLPEWFQQRFGGQVQTIHHRGTKKKTVWVWRLGRYEAVGEFLTAIRSHLVLKETQAWLCLEFLAQRAERQDYEGADRLGRPMRSPEQVAVEEGFYLALRGVNAGGLP